MTAHMIKVECNKCGGKYYVDTETLSFSPKKDEAFPHDCPHCEEGYYAIVIKD